MHDSEETPGVVCVHRTTEDITPHPLDLFFLRSVVSAWKGLPQKKSKRLRKGVMDGQTYIHCVCIHVIYLGCLCWVKSDVGPWTACPCRVGHTFNTPYKMETPPTLESFFARFGIGSTSISVDCRDLAKK